MKVPALNTTGFKNALTQFKIFGPPLALLKRRLRGRWWDHRTGSTDDPVEDLTDGPGLQTQDDGVGDVVTRRYELPIRGKDVSAEKVIGLLLSDPNELSPESYAVFSAPVTHVGQQLKVTLAGPWDGPVEVRQLTATKLVLGTMDGHMEAGWIRFEAEDTDDGVMFTIMSAASAGDPAFWMLHVFAKVGQWVQADMWSRVLEASAREAGDTDPPRVSITTLTHTDSA